MKQNISLDIVPLNPNKVEHLEILSVKWRKKCWIADDISHEWGEKMSSLTAVVVLRGVGAFQLGLI